MGRPTDFTSELADAICAKLAMGDSLRSICLSDDMPDESTVRGWAMDNREGFFPQYTRARDIGLDCRADRLIEEARSATDAGLGRLRFDADRWYLSKLASKRYGDKIDVTGELTHKVTRIEREIVHPQNTDR
jgi:hypothetical protein